MPENSGSGIHCFYGIAFIFADPGFVLHKIEDKRIPDQMLPAGPGGLDEVFVQRMRCAVSDKRAFIGQGVLLENHEQLSVFIEIRGERICPALNRALFAVAVRSLCALKERNPAGPAFRKVVVFGV